MPGNFSPSSFFKHKSLISLFTVNGLEGFIDNNLLRTSKIDPDLTNCGLGIDASHYLRQLYLRDSIKSSLSSALGGIPFALKAEVEKDLAMFAKHVTRVQFCFDGLDLYQFNLREDKSMKPDAFVGKRRAAWDAWTRLAEKGKYANAKDREELAKQAREAFDNGIYCSEEIANGSYGAYSCCGSIFDGDFGGA